MPGLRWSKDELEVLIHQVTIEKRVLPEIHVVGKSLAAINNQRRRLKTAGLLNDTFPGREFAPWMITELNELIKLTRDYGFSAALIAQLQLIPGRSRDAISKMMFRHGLGNPRIKLRARQACRLSKDQRQNLKRFLLTKGRLVPSKDIAQGWGLAEQTINTYRRRLGIQLSWHEARSSEEFAMKQKQRTRIFSLELHRRWAEWRSRLEKRLRTLKANLEHSASPPPTRDCRICGAHWFATREFFAVTKKAGRIRSGSSMSQTCRLCHSVRRQTANPPEHLGWRGAAA